MNGIDVSAWQNPVDWSAVKAHGIGFAFIKASEGISCEDATFASHHDGAKAVGIAVGAYHFFHAGQDPIAQAKFFLATIDGREGSLLPVVDVEELGQDGITDLATLTSRLGLFVDYVDRTLNGKKCMIYTDWNFWNTMMQGSSGFNGRSLWIAEYNSQASPTLPNGFKGYSVWQYTSSGQVPGIAGNVDLDRLHGEDLSIISR